MWAGRLRNVVLPGAITGGAFAILSRFGFVGDLPLWMLLSLLAVVGLLGEVTGRLVQADSSRRSLHIALAAQILSVSTIVYAIGWGPTLSIGYVFIIARALDTAGARVWRVAVFWTTVGIILGQVAIAAGLVSTYVPVPYVHGLAVLGILGMAFVMWLLGSKTEQSERALAERDAADREVRAALSLLNATLDSTADGILVVDNHGAITQFNSRFAQMWGIPDDLPASGDDAAALGFVLEQLVRPELFVAKVEELYADPQAESDDTLEFKDGRVFDRYSRPQRVDGNVVGRVWSFRDVTDRHHLVAQLAHHAFHDSLTGLANRALLRDRLDHALARAHRTGSTVTVLFCDLDGFKLVNDTLGHDTGDLLLVEASRRLEQNLRSGDTAARVGGDEFAIVLDDGEVQDAEALAERILETLREPFVVDDRDIAVRASIGIADSRNEHLDADALLCRADIAMYVAKSRGRDRYEVFEPVMQTELSNHQALQADLRRALAGGELTVHYEPLLDLQTQAIESFEALLRWNHPTRGLVPPDVFIPIAEETGLIIDIGRFVLREACRQTMQWRAIEGSGDLCISVNVSSHQLYADGFMVDVEAALRDTGLPPSSLILELTESTLLSDTSRVHDRLARLKCLGIGLAIDDFGTGYSSLAYLRSFPIDSLKIDRSFVNELSEDRRDLGRVMVQSIIGIGHNLRLKVIAEGIEEPVQLTELRAAGCNTGQGYLFSRPVPPEQIPELLARYARYSRPGARGVRSDRRDTIERVESDRSSPWFSTPAPGELARR